MNKLEDPKLIQTYNEIFSSIYPVVSDHIGKNRRFKSKKFASKDVDFGSYEAYAGALNEGYIVIDIDNKESKQEGSEEWDTLLIKLKLYKELNTENPKTFSHKTKTDGLHLFFKLPPGIYKDNLPSRIGDYIEIKKDESYIAGSYIETKGKGGKYSVLSKEGVMELPSAILGIILKKQIEKTKRKDKQEEVLKEVSDDEDFMMGNNEINWGDISYEEIKARMLTRVPDIDYKKWQYEMYLFISVYKNLESLGVNLDTSCEDFLISWSSRGVKAGKDDADIIRGLVRNFEPDIQINKEKLLPENNFLIQNYNNSTEFESYAKSVTSKIFKLKKKGTSNTNIKSFIENQGDMLASKLIEDIKKYRECFMLHRESKTDVITLSAFTTKNRWEKILSNSSVRKVRDPLLLETLFDILLKDGQTLYSNYLRKYCEFIFPDLAALGKFADKFLIKMKTSLYNVDLSPRRMPVDCDIMAFKNTAIKIQKQAPHVIAISWENVRSHRLTEEIYMSNQSVSSEDFDHFVNRGILFDTKQLREPLDKVSQDMEMLFAPMFWNFNLPYFNESYEEYERRLNKAAQERVTTFFSCSGKAMLRYKNKIAALFLILSGDEKSQDENGGNGKSFLGSDLLPTLFGRSKIFSRGISNSKENKDKFTEDSLVGAYIQILDDMSDSGDTNSVNVKHLIKMVGHRQSDVRGMQKSSREVETFYDTILLANNVDKRMASDAGNKRRIQYIVFYNTNKRCNSSYFETEEEMLQDHKYMSTSVLESISKEKDQNNALILEEKRLAYTNKALNKAYYTFFNSDFVKNLNGKYTITDNIYFTYIGILAEIFGVNLPEICTKDQLAIKTKAFIYCINLGNKVLQAGTFDGLKGFSPFEIEDVGTPIYNILREYVKVYDTNEKIGLPIDKRTFINFLINHLFIDVNLYRNEVNNFVNELPIVMLDDPYSGEGIQEFINIEYMDVGAIVSKLNKEGKDKTITKINPSLFAWLQTELNHEFNCSPFRVLDNNRVVLKEKVLDMLSFMGLRLKPNHIRLYFNKNKSVISNNWLRIRR